MILKWIKYLGLFLVTIVVLAVVVVLVTQRVSDGPNEFLQGGPFKTGELADEPVPDWSFALGKPIEFELVGYGTSRTAGYVMHDGLAYMTCDLGFMWSRFGGSQKAILNLIYVFKRWHTDAEVDGRALVRVDGRDIYKANFVKVEDAELVEILKGKTEDLAREYFAPAELGPRPTEAPNDIWFFRMDPRA